MVGQWAELRGAKCRTAQQGLLDQLEELTLHPQSHADPRAEGQGVSSAGQDPATRLPCDKLTPAADGGPDGRKAEGCR